MIDNVVINTMSNRPVKFSEGSKGGVVQRGFGIQYTPG